jgi:autotransporter-associated beta strand protein
VNSLGNTNGIQFHNSATAGTGTVYINNAPQFFPDHGGIEFFDTSSAGSGVFTNTAAADEFNGGVMNFYNSSTAGNSTITNSGFPTFNHNHARTDFSDTSTAGNATIITNSGSTSTADNGDTEFFDTSSAGNATLIANGGPGQVATISFNQRSTGGTARVELLGGILDVSSHMSGVLTIGSLEGNGVAYLGTLNPAVNLTVGANNLSTTFSGLLSKGTRFGGDGGAFTKTGRGTLTLTGANTYTAGTTVNAGTLVVSNTTGTGTGPVVVTGGTLAGNGIIAGAVTIGGNNTMAAILSPAGKKQATLTLQSTLTFAISSTYTCSYRGNSRKVQFDQVVANGVTINDGAGFNFPGQTQGSLRIGTVLTVINNTSATPIAGTFNNLADGAIISANGGNFQASYEGGDGNDLTLTVVP